VSGLSTIIATKPFEINCWTPLSSTWSAWCSILICVCWCMYMWTALALSINLDFWLRCLLYEDCHGIRA
jgi:hypothetical protein